MRWALAFGRPFLRSKRRKPKKSLPGFQPNDIKRGLSGRSRKGEAHTQTRMAIQTEMTAEANRKLISYINVKLALLGAAVPAEAGDSAFSEIASALVARYREEERLLASYLSPADQRIQTFLYDYLQDVPVAKLPNKTFVLDRPGLAR